MNFDLSILIPARNERWLARTVEGILERSSERTEVIAVLDGAWGDLNAPDEEQYLPQHERLSILYNPVPVGQRAATNQAARLSNARWVMKCDAHVLFSEGFDEVLMDRLSKPGREDWTIVPKMFNLYGFEWVCRNCGWWRYQSPTPEKCESCGQKTVELEVVWKPRRKHEFGTRDDGPETTAMRFDQELRFQYWSEFKPRQRWEDGCAETMSLLGACWMLTRERYWALDICDEAHGSWGQQGTEVACKSWLSGGKLMCCRDAWFAHLFRTQGGDFGFPYPQPGSDIEKARSYSRKLWIGGEWDKAVRPLSWLLDHFDPVPDWDSRKGLIFYTDHRVPLKIAREVQSQIRDQHLPITSATLKPMPKMGTNVLVEGKRGVLTMFRQILAALEASEQDVIFFCEHDVLYHPSHFEFRPERDDVFYYNTNVWKVWPDGFAARTADCRQTSGLCANRELLLAHYRERVRRVEAEGFSTAMGYEPGTHSRSARVDNHKSATWESEYPNVDIRLETALTRSKRSPNEFRNKKYAAGWTESTAAEIPGWSELPSLMESVR